MIDDGRYCLLSLPPFYGSARINRNGWDPEISNGTFRIGPEPSTTGLTRVPGFKSISSSGLSFPIHGDTPLLRGDVTRRVSLGNPSPLEDWGPLSGKDLLAEDALDSRLPLQVVYALREDVRQLS